MRNSKKNNSPQPFPAGPSRRTLLKGAGSASAVAVGASSAGVVVDEWAVDNFVHFGLDFIGGANFWVHTDHKPIGAAKMDTFGEAPSWGEYWEAFIPRKADRSNTSDIQKTTLPNTNNYLELDPGVKDSFGLPVTLITARFRENEPRIAAFAQDKMEGWYRAAGATHVLRFGLGNAMGATTHVYGGTRMGDDTDTNVADRWGFCHEIPNLGILGASLMVQVVQGIRLSRPKLSPGAPPNI